MQAAELSCLAAGVRADNKRRRIVVAANVWRNDGGRRRVDHPVIAYLTRHRRVLQALTDAGIWLAAIPFAAALRYDLDLHRVEWGKTLAFAGAAALAQVVAGLAAGLYTGRWRFGSFDEVAGLTRATAIVTLGLYLFDLPESRRTVPLSVPLVAGVTALVATAGVRFVWRLFLEHLRKPHGETLQRMVVFGAGDGAAQVLTSILNNPDSPYLPVALLDDDPAKRHLRIKGVRVQGNRHDLADVAKANDAKVVLIAIPSADSTTIKAISERATEAGLDVKVLPSVTDLFGATVDDADIRDITPADLLGRHEIDTDIASIAAYLTGKRVLVTGAGGSIGSELCRQIYRFAPEALVMLDRDESALHAVQLSIHGRALLDTPELVVADIRDGKRLEQVFGEWQPHVVFHAAALKHLPLLEMHPGEAVQTNVWGTLNVLTAAAKSGVERFVNISTDKAADPCSVLGWSKRITERLTAWFGGEHDGAWLSVRFGNVLGSRGSVLTAFQAQIAAGGPITVTHPEVTRYFMTIEEAVQLVVQAGAIGLSGEALVLDMGTPIRIVDVARLLVARADRPVELAFTGLRPGEKLNEDLFGSNEPCERRVHPSISHVRVPPIAASEVLEIDPFGDRDAVIRAMADNAAAIALH